MRGVGPSRARSLRVLLTTFAIAGLMLLTGTAAGAGVDSLAGTVPSFGSQILRQGRRNGLHHDRLLQRHQLLLHREPVQLVREGDQVWFAHRPRSAGRLRCERRRGARARRGRCRPDLLSHQHRVGHGRHLGLRSGDAILTQAIEAIEADVAAGHEPAVAPPSVGITASLPPQLGSERPIQG